jgi:hypothetical protein
VKNRWYTHLKAKEGRSQREKFPSIMSLSPVLLVQPVLMPERKSFRRDVMKHIQEIA